MLFFNSLSDSSVIDKKASSLGASIVYKPSISLHPYSFSSSCIVVKSPNELPNSKRFTAKKPGSKTESTLLIAPFDASKSASTTVEVMVCGLDSLIPLFNVFTVTCSPFNISRTSPSAKSVVNKRSSVGKATWKESNSIKCIAQLGVSNIASKV